MRNFASGIYGGRDRGIDISDQHIRPNNWLFCFVHWGANANHPAIRHCCRTCISKSGDARAKLYVMDLSISRACGIDFLRHNFEIVDFHKVSRLIELHHSLRRRLLPALGAARSLRTDCFGMNRTEAHAQTQLCYHEEREEHEGNRIAMCLMPSFF
jgi:hypothetical protein